MQNNTQKINCEVGVNVRTMAIPITKGFRQKTFYNI